MLLLVAALAIALITFVVWPRLKIWRAGTPAERAFTMRFTIFTWFIGFLFVLGFMFLPDKGRVVMLLPAFIAGVSLTKWWKKSRARLRREARMDTNFERARRIN